MWDTFDPWLWSSQPHQLMYVPQSCYLNSPKQSINIPSAFSFLYLGAILNEQLHFSMPKRFSCASFLTRQYLHPYPSPSHMYTGKKNSTGVSTICKCCISSVHIHLLSSNKKVAHSLFSSKQGQKCALRFLHLYDGNKYPKRVQTPELKWYEPR